MPPCLVVNVSTVCWHNVDWGTSSSTMVGSDNAGSGFTTKELDDDELSLLHFAGFFGGDFILRLFKRQGACCSELVGKQQARE